jgi:hypothetical protein
MRGVYICDKQGHWGLKCEPPFEIVGTFLTEDVGRIPECIDSYIESISLALHDSSQPLILSGNLCHINCVCEVTTLSYIYSDNEEEVFIDTLKLLAALNHWKQLVNSVLQGEQIRSGTTFSI